MKSTVLAGLAITAQATKYGNNHPPVWPDTPRIEKHFPPINVTLRSPAFISPDQVPDGFSKGTEGPTSDAILHDFLHGLASRNPWMTYQDLGYVSEEGRSLPFIQLSSSNVSWNRTVQIPETPLSSSRSKIRVWLQGGVHGSEPAGDQSILALLGKMDAEPQWTASLLENLEIMMLPRYNPDGVAYFQRDLASNFDPNRDHVKLARQQTRDIKRVFSEFAPHVAADMHEFRASAMYGGQYLPGADAMFSAAKNLNIHTAIRHMSEQLFAPAIGTHLKSRGLRWEPYVTGRTSLKHDTSIVFHEAGSDAKIGRNAMGLSQAIVFLCEVRGIGIADQEFHRRTATALTILESILQTASDHAHEIIRVVEDGVNDFANSDEPIVVSDHTDKSTRNWTFVDFDSGDLVQVPVVFHSTTPTSANLTRPRPEAYLIPRTWAEVAARLEILGLQVETVSESWNGTVEALTITSSSIGRYHDEGVVLTAVTTNSTSTHVQLPPGSFRVSTRQKNAALAFVTLEPENVDSYVSWGIIPMEKGDQYPIFRATS
ncbi:Carboxypeptidase 2 [Lecanosticta acicola]|uniref:Carboxypeptidase M14B n=1 Tax=Lecanosticta acicola TaxID=111012 RepID=A0AAI9E950_9PEZI|nr:Carboxypeptidase 2 [Lecanosticta acicola]